MMTQGVTEGVESLLMLHNGVSMTMMELWCDCSGCRCRVKYRGKVGTVKIVFDIKAAMHAND